MSTPSLSWPALAGRDGRPIHPAGLPARLHFCLHFRRGIWGKVHGARTDYRWIAATPGFGGGLDRGELARRITVGIEDLPGRSFHWRPLSGRYLAVATRPSRALDATGRSGFLEKQVLEWIPEARDGAGVGVGEAGGGRWAEPLPAVLGALILLARAGELDDRDWWSRAEELAFDPGRTLALAEESVPAGPGVGIDLEALIGRGIGELRAAFAGTADPTRELARLYGALAAGRKPALLGGIEAPLPAGALAALLLPLSRERADALSLAGWIPSSRYLPEELGRQWDVLAVPASVAEGSPDPDGESWERGMRMAEALLSARPATAVGGMSVPPLELPDYRFEVISQESATTPSHPPPRPGCLLPLTPEPSPGAPGEVRHLYDFARAVDRRWLSREKLAAASPTGRIRPLTPGDPDSAALAAWIDQVERGRPWYTPPEIWAVKVDLLRAAAWALLPWARAEVASRSDGRVKTDFYDPVE